MKFYAVVRGINPGIYTTWGDAEKQVKGFSGAKYKSFFTKREAELFLNDVSTVLSVKCSNDLPLTNLSVKNKETIVYTDGSCISGVGGYGFVIVKDDSHQEYFGKVPYHPCTNNIAELFAIKMALSKVEGNIKIYSDSEYSINIITGAKKAHKNLDLLSEIKELCRDRTPIFEHVRAHQGDTYNEIADSIANQGRYC